MSYNTENPDWVTFYPKFNSGLYIEQAGYFDERPEIHASVTQLIVLAILPILLWLTPFAFLLLPFVLFGWGSLYIHLPIKTGIQDCESAAWGLNYHNNTLWIYIGGGLNYEGGRKWKTITMPWAMTWVRTSTLMKGEHAIADLNEWFHETKNNHVNYLGGNATEKGSYEWLHSNKWKETHEYTDKYDNTKLNATISVVEREWLAFQWTSLFAKRVRTIDVRFDKEVGKGKASWKGGTTGCGYEIKPSETPLECLRRMEAERDDL